MLIESKFLNFVRNEAMEKGTTQIWDVTNKEGVTLGRIGFLPQWRRYVYTPDIVSVLDSECLKDVVRALDKLMLDRKVEKQNKQTDGM